MNPVLRDHPIEILYHLWSVIKDRIYVIITILLSITALEKYGKWINLGGVLAASLLIVYSLLKWKKKTCQKEGEYLHTKEGVWEIETNHFSIHTVNMIEISDNVIKRLFSVINVDLIVPGGKDFRLVVTKKKYEQLKKGMLSEITTTKNKKKQILTLREIMILSFTWRQLIQGYALAAIIVGEIVDKAVRMGNLEKIVVSIVLSALASIIFTFMRYGTLRIERQQNQILIQSGVLSRKQTTMDVKRIQMIEMVEPVLLQIFGYVRVYAHVLSLTGKGKAIQLIPISKKESARHFLSRNLPEFTYHDRDYRSVPKSLFNYCFSYLDLLLPFPLLLSIWFHTGWINLLYLAFVLNYLFLFLEWRDNGIHIEKETITVQKRHISKHTFISKREFVQSVSIQNTFWKKGKNYTLYLAHFNSPHRIGIENEIKVYCFPEKIKELWDKIPT